MTAARTHTGCCDLSLDELLQPGGWTSTVFDDEDYVSEDQWLWLHDRYACLAERFERAIAEAERRGIDRETLLAAK